MSIAAARSAIMTTAAPVCPPAHGTHIIRQAHTRDKEGAHTHTHTHSTALAHIHGTDTHADSTCGRAQCAPLRFKRMCLACHSPQGRPTSTCLTCRLAIAQGDAHGALIIMSYGRVH